MGGTGENDRVTYSDEFLKKKEKHGTHVSDSNGEEEKDPEVQVRPLARTSALVGYPEREEPKLFGCVEGHCEISLCAKKSNSVPNGRGKVYVAHQRDEKCQILSGFTPPSPAIPRRRS